MLKLKLQYFGHLMGTTNSLEKTLMLGKIEGRRRRGQQRMRWLASPTPWTWVSASSGRYQRTRKPWCAVVHKVTKSQTLLSNCTTKVGAYVFKIIISFSSIDRLSLVHYVVFFFVPWQSLFYLLSNSNGSEPRDRLVVRGGSTGDLEQIIISL